MTRPLLAAAAALALAPAAVHGATVSSVTSCADEGKICGSNIDFSAAPGEVNDVAVSRDSSGAFVLRDSVATITRADGCELTDSHTARCVPASGPAGGMLGFVRASLGDGDDALTATTGDVSVDGGFGADRLNAFEVTYAVDSVVGGDGSDNIVGSARDELLDGGPGDDIVRGGRGNDTLTGGAGVDTFDGGTGADELITTEPSGQGRTEQVSCGQGRDTVGGSSGGNPYVDAVDVLDRSCELARMPGFDHMARAPNIAHGRAVFQLASACGCSGRVTLSVVRGGKATTVASGRVRDRRRKFAIALN